MEIGINELDGILERVGVIYGEGVGGQIGYTVNVKANGTTVVASSTVVRG